MASEPPAGATAESNRAFTGKSLTAGLLLALVVVVVAWFNDQYLMQSPAIGNFLPALPFGLTLALALVWNPICGRWRPLCFSPRELAVILGLTLLVSWLPVSGFIRYFQRSLVTPHVQAALRPEWRRLDILGHLPREIFPLGGSAEAFALDHAIGAERAACAAGAVDGELAAAGLDRPAYAAAIDLAALIPPRQWRDGDRALVRANTLRAWQRVQDSDARRWAGAGALLQAMPETLAAGDASPPAWRLVHRRVDAAFAERLPEARVEYERVYAGMTQGLPVGDEILSPSEVPLAAWIPALVYWVPLVLLLALSILMLTVVVHRQWSHHEQLTYPIAAVGTALLRRREGALVSDIVRSRLFWAGVLPIFAMHLLNYLAIWFPGWLPSINLHWWQGGMIRSMAPSVGIAGGANALAYGDIYFVIIGLAFFISSEVSFTMGISGFLVILFSVQFYTITGTTADLGSARSGAFVGYVLILLYTGRTYYWAVLSKALGLHGGASGDHAEPVWAARLFILAFAGFTAVLVGAFGLDWLIALAYALTIMVFFLVLTRIVCETGVPFVQAGWHPAQLVTSVFGISAIGAAPLVLIHYLGTVLSEDPRESLMPFAANSMKMAEDTGVRRLRLAIVGFAVIAVAMIVAIAATTWGMYNFGSITDGWAQQVVGHRVGEATRGVTTLVETGQYAATAAASGLEKLPLIADNIGKARELGWIAFGIVAVVAVSLLRFRWAGFYLHPVLFLVWDTYSAQRIWLSFLLGWIAKELVVRFGGGRVYQELKPLFIGLIVGELLAVLMTLTVGWIYHLATGLMPRTMSIFVG